MCAQSRCSIFTGNYPHVAGHRSLEALLKPWEPNLFRSLREEAGYHVACLAPRGDTFAPEVTELSVDEYGFLEPPETVPGMGRPGGPGGGLTDAEREDIWRRLFYRGRREDPAQARDYDDAVVRSALRWLERPPTNGQPWVLFLPLLFPHCPFGVEEPWFSLHDRAALPPPADPSLHTGHEPRYMAANRARYGTHRADRAVWAEVAATYYGMIARLDEQFGRILAAAQSLPDGAADRTVTLFFTDHGEYLGDHGLVEKWPSGLSDSLVREPLLVGGCGLPRGAVYDGMVEMVDLLPTVLQMAGVGEHFPHCGRSLCDVLTALSRRGDGGEEGEPPALPHHKDYAYSEGGFLLREEPLLEHAPWPYDIKAALQHEDTALVGRAVSVRDREWTFVYRLYEPPELYSRARDPQELHNLAELPEYADVRQRLEANVLRWMVESSDFLPYQKDPRFPKVDLEDPMSQWEKRAP